MQQNGVDAEGYPIYERIPDDNTVLVFVAARVDVSDLKAQLEALGVVVHMNADINEIEALYPKFCAGQVIPRI